MAAVNYGTRNTVLGTGEYGIQTSTCRRQNHHGRVYIEARQQQITCTHTCRPSLTRTQSQFSIALTLSLSPTLSLSHSCCGAEKNNNTSWPNFCSRCFCLRRCQRRKQGGVRHRRTLIKHSQRPHTHKRGTQTHKMDGGAGRERECEREGQTRVRARRPDAAALSVTNVPLFCFMCVVSAPHCSFFNCHFSHKFTQSSAALLTALPVSSS